MGPADIARGDTAGRARLKRRVISLVGLLIMSISMFAAFAPERALGLTQPETGATDPAPVAPDPITSDEEPGQMNGGEVEAEADPSDPSEPSVDLLAGLMLGWSGYGTYVYVTAVVFNTGSETSSGHTMTFIPQYGNDRTVTAPVGCAPEGSGFRCTGGALQPGEMSEYGFVFSPSSREGDKWPPVWTVTVTGGEADPDPSNNESRFELPDSTYMYTQVESDVKTRVEDADGDGSASPGEKMQVYVYFANDSEHELQNVIVEITGTLNDHRRLQETIPPGGEKTVRFDGTVPDLGPDAVTGVEATVSAEALGSSFWVSGGTLMLIGPSIVPNPEGPFGPQSPAKEYDPWDRSTVDIDLSAPEWQAVATASSARALDAQAPDADPVAASALGESLVRMGTRIAPPVSAAAPQAGPHTRVVEASTPSAGAPLPLVLTGVSSLREPILMGSALVGLGVILSQLGVSRLLGRRRDAWRSPAPSDVPGGGDGQGPSSIRARG